jgi:RNA polymerase sigma-70 factor (ECF subfamily)
MAQYQTASPDFAYAAFNELYVRYSNRVYNFLNKKTLNQADSDDLLQKVFIKIHESKHLYKNKYKFDQWIFVIARTQALDYFRSEKRYRDRLSKIDDTAFAASENVEDHFFTEINSDQNELLQMKYIDDLSYQEISKILNKSEVSLRKSVSRIVNRLKTGVV